MASTQAQLKMALQLHQKGDLHGAEAHYSQILSVEPNNYTALVNVATIYLSKGEWQHAERSLKWASLTNATNPEVFYKLGFSLQQQGKLEEAIVAYQNAIKKQDNYPAVYSQLGMIYHQQGKFEEAIGAFQKCIALQPNSADGYYNLGYTLQSSDRFEEAIPYYLQALKIQPHHSPAHTNLAIAFRKQGKLSEALNSFHAALALQSNDATLYYNYALTLYEAEQFEEAVSAYQKAISLKPDYPEARLSLAIALLLLDNYQIGWQEYEWRFQANPQNYKLPIFQQWIGPQAKPQEIVLIEEQGMGDLVQFMRYGISLQELAPVVSIAAQKKFCPLLELSGIFHKIYPLPMDAPTIPPDAQWISLLSLPAKLGVTRENPIIKQAYLKSDPLEDQHWQNKIKAGAHFVIGLNWQGNPETEKNEFKGRSFSLSEYAPLAAMPGIQFVSLQKGYGSEQLESCSFKDKFIECQNEISETWDLLATLAVIQSCDLVITSDTSIAHFAGALGKPTWILLKKVPDWRWGIEGENCAWYPSARLFRQTEAGNWAQVILKVKEELHKLVNEWTIKHTQ